MNEIKSTESERKLKLFVVGESSADPDKWCGTNRAIVIAHDEAEARKMTELHSIAEILFDTAKIVMTEEISRNI